MQNLRDLENQTIFLLREVYFEFKKPAILWSMGKDSTSLVWMTKKAFIGEVPFPVIHIDTGYKFPQMYAYRDKYAKEWNLDLRVAENKEAKARGVSPTTGEKLECCGLLKTQALKDYVRKEGYDALILAIRRDEHGIRAKERYFSPRDKNFKWDYKNQPLEIWDQHQDLQSDQDHMRVHPILHWRELDIWEYIQQEGIPINEMYFSKDGKRYRSLGCQPCTNPINSTASTVDEIVEELRNTKLAEREGRAQDKESSFTMQKLRALGYM